MKLELKHVIPYLPYGLNCEFLAIWGNGNHTRIDTHTRELTPQLLNEFSHKLDKCKPILRPFSDLNKGIQVNGEQFVPQNKLELVYDELFGLHTGKKHQELTDIVHICEPATKTLQWYLILHLPKWIVDKLIEWHFDLFELIPQGLAIDINTIDK